jgi:uncharacterized phage protein gp47/JayE
MTFPLPTLAPTLTTTGISIPSYADVFQSLQASFQSIYGTDAYMDPDSQDGQLLAIVARAIDDANKATVAVYQSFSPATSQGSALSTNVKINGIARLVATYSQVNLRLVGVAGTIITEGRVADVNKVRWNLPASVTIPLAGEITVTATCQDIGAITAGVDTVNQILTPTLGWQSATNLAEAAPGSPVESDADLRRRQTQSVALPSLTVLAGLVGAVEAITGVTQVKAYENDTGAADANGVPGHSIALVVEGGDAATIAGTILLKKTPGTGTYGTTSISVIDSLGITTDINFFVPTTTRMKVAVTVHPVTAGWSVLVGESLVQAIADYINALMIGDDVEVARLYLPAQLFGAPDSLSYNVTVLEISAYPDAVAAADVAIAFNSQATSAIADIVLTVV